jgi:hypothetical protein
MVVNRVQPAVRFDTNTDKEGSYEYDTSSLEKNSLITAL